MMIERFNNGAIKNMVNTSKFEECSRAVLEFLYQCTDFKLWMVTRTVGNDWTILHAEDHAYGIEEGAVFRWKDSLCSRMVDGRGPRFAPRAQEIAAYSSAPISQQVSIGAYMGVPVLNSDGSLFGTLCAIDPTAKSESIRDKLPLVELYAKLLSIVLITENCSNKFKRLLDTCRIESSTDVLTGLLNRSGWETSITREEAKSRRYNSELSALVVDLDNLKLINDSYGHEQGDELIKMTADCLRWVLRDSDIVARIGGDEFGIIAIECDQAGAEVVQRKIKKALSNYRIEASVGMSVRTSEGLVAAINDADRRMYEEKALRKPNT